MVLVDAWRGRDFFNSKEKAAEWVQASAIQIYTCRFMVVDSCHDWSRFIRWVADSRVSRVGHFVVVLELFWGRLGAVLWSSWGRLGVVLRSF